MIVPISLCIITKNEEARLEKCLESVKGWVDEIIVVDAMSTDATIHLAEKFTDKIFKRAWTGFSDQRNFCLDNAKNEWVMFLDADERVTPALRDRIIDIFSKGPDCALFKIKRQEHLIGREINYGTWNPSYQDKLFNKTNVRFVGEVHEYPAVKGKIGYIEEKILHQSFENLESMFDKFNVYTTLDAQKLFKKGKRHSAGYMFFSGIAMFWKSFFRRKGFKDGIWGLFIAVIEGMYFLVRQAKLYFLWERYDENDGNKG